MTLFALFKNLSIQKMNTNYLNFKNFNQKEKKSVALPTT